MAFFDFFEVSGPVSRLFYDSVFCTNTISYIQVIVRWYHRKYLLMGLKFCWDSRHGRQYQLVVLFCQSLHQCPETWFWLGCPAYLLLPPVQDSEALLELS
jgi:hypothetical protein